MRYDRGSQNQDLNGRLGTIAAIGRFSSIDLVLDCMGIIFPIPPHI